MKKKNYAFVQASSNVIEDKKQKREHSQKNDKVPEKQIHPEVLWLLHGLKDNHKNEMLIRLLEANEKNFLTTIILFNLRMLCMAIINSFMILYLPHLIGHFNGDKD